MAVHVEGTHSILQAVPEDDFPESPDIIRAEGKLGSETFDSVVFIRGNKIAIDERRDRYLRSHGHEKLLRLMVGLELSRYD